MSDGEIELFRTHSAAQERRAYFLLAAAGAAIAFGVTRTSDTVWSDSTWLWFASIACWALSFYCGLRHMAYVSSVIYANSDLLRVTAGRHPEVGGSLQLMTVASEGIKSAMKKNTRRSAIYADLQFIFLVLGGAVFIAWHVFEMYLRGIVTLA